MLLSQQALGFKDTPPPNCSQGVLLTRFWVLVRMVVGPLRNDGSAGSVGKGRQRSVSLP